MKALVRRFMADPRAVAERVYVSCGVYESLICENRGFVPVLGDTGMEVRFDEIRDGHNWPATSSARRCRTCSARRRGASGDVPSSNPCYLSHVADVVRHIEHSLGADLCWPICYEAVLDRLDLLPIDGDTVRLATDRVTVEPFDLRQPSRVRRRGRPA